MRPFLPTGFMRPFMQSSTSTSPASKQMGHRISSSASVTYRIASESFGSLRCWVLNSFSESRAPWSPETSTGHQLGSLIYCVCGQAGNCSKVQTAQRLVVYMKSCDF